jgi:hypothetical protein
MTRAGTFISQAIENGYIYIRKFGINLAAQRKRDVALLNEQGREAMMEKTLASGPAAFFLFV